mgnify:CR=1 FL=1
MTLGKRARGLERNQRLPFAPPENWHEPREDGQDYRIIVQDPGIGYRHVVTTEEVRERLSRHALASAVPPSDLDGLRRRTRAMMGRCQGFYCGAEVDAMLRGGAR